MRENSVIISNFFWRFFERIGAKGVELLVTIILARILTPEIYGSIALITVFITLLQVFVDSGLGTALVQKIDADDLDFSTVFFFNIFFCICIYGLIFLSAPYVAEFYDNTQLTPVIRFIGLTVVVSGVKNVQQAYVSKKMMFRKFFFATLTGTIGAAILGIVIAYCGGGIWALAVQQVFNVLIDTVMLWILVKWRPKRMFSFERLKRLYSFGWKLLASQLLETGYNELRQLIIGKMYSDASLAYYNRGKQFPQFITSNIDTSINSILLPAMSKEQDNKSHVRDMTRRAIKITTYIMAPMMMGLAFLGEPVVRVILSEKWLPCVPYMRIFCITYMFLPIHTANLNAIKAMGRSDLFLKLEIIKKIMGLIVLAITAPISVMAMGYSLLFTSVASQIINSRPNKKLLNYGYMEQLKDILPGILLAVAMGCIIYPVLGLGLSDIVTLLISVPLGAVIYIAGSILFKLDSFQYLWGIVKPVIMNTFVRKIHKKS
jgi:O-antigen/teichoic acid export membrane protein